MSRMVNFRLDEVDLNLLQQKAEEDGLSVSAYVRKVVKQSMRDSTVGDELVKQLAKDPGLRATLHRLIVLGIS
jgi:hypothetical protein